MNPKKTDIMKLAVTTLASLTIIGCAPEFDDPVDDSSNYTQGNADFSKYVAVGDSLTAGYADGALYKMGQENSYPNILAQRLKKVGGGDFKQPLVNDNLGGLLFGGQQNPEFGNRLVLNPQTSSPEPIAGTPTTEVYANGPLTGPFNNMGVPGAKSFHLASPTYGNPAGLATDPATANPYFVRFASSTGASVIGDAAAQQPTFFTLWIGNNDVLSYATSGGIGEDQTGNLDPTSYSSVDITDPNVFANVYSQYVDALSAAGGKGVLINIPDVSTIPFFTTVPFNPVPLDPATADTLNAAYAAYNGGLASLKQAGMITQDELDKRTIAFSAGQNAVVIMDEDLTDLTGVNAALINMRQATADDLVILTASSKIGTLVDAANPSSAWGVGVPLEDGDVLIPSEIAAINTARTAYNATIKALADASDDLALVDAAALLGQIKNGFNFGTGSVNSNYATGLAFSLDGVHPTARGYAIIANAIMDAMKDEFGAKIQPVDPVEYTAVFFK
jgi:lysophospholipase L1-like esterase